MEAPRCPFSRGMWANMPSTMRLIQGIAAASRRGCLERWGCTHGLVRLPWAALTDAAGADGESCLLPFHAVDLWFDRTASHPQRAEPPHPDVTEQPSAAQALFLTSLGGGQTSQSSMDGGSNFIYNPPISWLLMLQPHDSGHLGKSGHMSDILGWNFWLMIR